MERSGAVESYGAALKMSISFSFVSFDFISKSHFDDGQPSMEECEPSLTNALFHFRLIGVCAIVI